MILVDTSAWIEFLRDTNSEACTAVDRLIDADLAICDAVAMEVLGGARNERQLIQLRALRWHDTPNSGCIPTRAPDFGLDFSEVSVWLDPNGVASINQQRQVDPCHHEQLLQDRGHQRRGHDDRGTGLPASQRALSGAIAGSAATATTFWFPGAPPR